MVTGPVSSPVGLSLLLWISYSEWFPIGTFMLGPNFSESISMTSRVEELLQTRRHFVATFPPS